MISTCLFFKPHDDCLQNVVAGLQPGVDGVVHEVMHNVWVSSTPVDSGVQVTVQGNRKASVHRSNGHFCASKSKGFVKPKSHVKNAKKEESAKATND